MATLRIFHSSLYTYARPVQFGRHRLVVRPREGHDVRVEQMQIDVAPRHDLEWVRDVFGNSVALVDFLEPAAELQIHAEVVVSRTLPFPIDMAFERRLVPYPLAYDVLETPFASAYQASSYPDDLDAVRAWLAGRFAIPDPEDAEESLYALGKAIHGAIKYRRRPEKGVQTPRQTIELASGSCRDLATLMLECARTLGVAARFVSGYLNCPASEAGRAAMHAWVEVYLPLVGWRGYDPTLGEPVSLKHVVAGVSNHPRGVMPVSGVFGGTSADFLNLTANVKIETVDASSAGRGT